MLGYLWYILEPLMQTLILYLVFGVLLGNKDSLFVLHILIGLMVWQWFESSLNIGALGIRNHLGVHNIVKLPLFVYPSVYLLVQFWKLICLFVVIILLSSTLGFYPNLAYFHLPVVFTTAFVLIVSATLPLSIVVTYFPDFLLFTSSILRLLFFFSGIFYFKEVIPDELIFYFNLNPVASVMDMFRQILIYGSSPDYSQLLYCVYISIVFSLMYCFLYFNCRKTLLKRNTI